MKKWLLVVICIVLAELVGIIGGFATTNSIPTWYSSLIKPSFNPPNWIFGPVWTTLYAMIGISFYLFLTSKGKSSEKRKGYWIFGIQMFLNLIWTPVFFGLHQTLLAFIIIALLWLSIILNFLEFYKTSKTSAYLLIPYWLWVSFASILNFSLWILNR